MYAMYNKVELPENTGTFGTGWLPPMPDLRDYSVEHEKIKGLGKKLGIRDETTTIPESVNLRPWCSPVENQLSIGSCTAHATVGMVEYLQKRAHGKYIDGSRLFLYKATRNLMKVTGDTGGWLRNAMGALALCGVPDEKYWPYVVEDFDKEPPAFVYAVADNFEALSYFCHDPQGANVAPTTVLQTVKQYLAAGLPSVFGIWGFPSFGSSTVKGDIPYPSPGERAQWGHAIVAMGYDDHRKITNTQSNKETVGALLIRNSWGEGWGEYGYGWLPYDYVLSKYAMDFWSLAEQGWVDTKQFGI